MSLPEKKLPTVGLNNGGYSAQRVQPVDYGGLDRGFDGLSRMAEAFRRTQEAEDVSRLINEGLREAQKLQNDYCNLKGTDKANDFSFDDFSTQIAALREKYAAMAKTQKGGDRVFNALDGHYTNIFGKVHAHYLESKNAQFAAENEAQFANYADMSANEDPTQWVTGHTGVVAIAENESARLGHTSEQAEANKKKWTQRFIESGVDAWIAKGDYKAAKKFLDFAVSHCGGLFGHANDDPPAEPKGEGEGEDAPKGGKGGEADKKAYAGFFGKCFQAVERLRRRATGYELVVKFAGENKRGPQGMLVLLQNPNSAAARKLRELAEKEGLSWDDVSTGIQRYKSDYDAATARQAEIFLAPMYDWARKVDFDGVNRETGQKEEGLSPREQLELAQAKAERAGDRHRMQAIEAARKLWDALDAAQRAGREKPTEEQIILAANLRDHILNAKAYLQRPINIQFLGQLLLEGKIHAQHFDELTRLSTSAGQDINKANVIGKEQEKDAEAFAAAELMSMEGVLKDLLAKQGEYDGWLGLGGNDVHPDAEAKIKAKVSKILMDSNQITKVEISKIVRDELLFAMASRNETIRNSILDAIFHKIGTGDREASLREAIEKLDTLDALLMISGREKMLSLAFDKNGAPLPPSRYVDVLRENGFSEQLAHRVAYGGWQLKLLEEVEATPTTDEAALAKKAQEEERINAFALQEFKRLLPFLGGGMDEDKFVRNISSGGENAKVYYSQLRELLEYEKRAKAVGLQGEALKEFLKAPKHKKDEFFNNRKIDLYGFLVKHHSIHGVRSDELARATSVNPVQFFANLTPDERRRVKQAFERFKSESKVFARGQ